MFTKADSEGFILVFPEALNNEITGAPLWNDKDYFPQNGGAVDDLGYVLHLIDTIQFSLSIDTNRIYAAGFSNGADFTQFLGSQLPCSFAGLAAVAGSTANQITQADTTLIYFPSPEVPTSMMIVRGKQDQRIPFFGGINNQGSNTTSARQDRDFWLTANNCDTSQYTISNFGVDTLVIQTYQQCDENTKVQVVAPKLLAHVWPNANDNVYWNANVAIIDFLKQFENSWCQLSSSNVQEEIFTDFSIYPNPSKGELYISLDIQNTYNREIRVFDIQGDQIRKVVLKGPKTRVNLETINSGIYFFKLFNGNIHIATKKVLLN